VVYITSIRMCTQWQHTKIILLSLTLMYGTVFTNLVSASSNAHCAFTASTNQIMLSKKIPLFILTFLPSISSVYYNVTYNLVLPLGERYCKYKLTLSSLRITLHATRLNIQNSTWWWICVYVLRRISQQTATFVLHNLSGLVFYSYNRGWECSLRGTHWGFT
jgi:hypothetical protein